MFDIKTFMAATAGLDFKMMLTFTMGIQNMTFHNPNVQKLCKDPKEHFDVIVAEWMFNELYIT
jgi:hypothetical protein